MTVPALRVDTHARGDQTVWQRVLDARVLIAVSRVDDLIVECVLYRDHRRSEAIFDCVGLHPLCIVIATLCDDAGQTWRIT